MIRLRFTWRDQVTPRAEAAARNFRASLVRGMRRAGAILWREWKLQVAGPRTATRLGRVTGALFGSIHQREERDGLVQVVGTGEIYAPVHEHGAVIVPRRASVLRWIGPTGGAIFARRVVIPARPHLAPAFERARTQMLLALREGVREGLAGGR